jgi:hypothetical protein
MILVPNDKLQLVTSSAAAIDSLVSYIDVNDSTGAFIGGGTQKTAIASATTTDILATPAASRLRRMKWGNWRNKDASLSCNVTVVLDVSATDYEIHKTTLAPGDCLQYIEGIGFFLLTSAALLDKMLYVTANSIHATAATFAAITGLSVPVLSGKRYAFYCCLLAITNATTTGAQFGIGGVAMTDMVVGGRSVLLGSPTAASTNTTGVVTAVDTAVMAQTTGAAVNQPHEMSGSFQPSADGTFSIKATSEVTVANGLIVLKGSWAYIRQTDN